MAALAMLPLGPSVQEWAIFCSDQLCLDQLQMVLWSGQCSTELRFTVISDGGAIATNFDLQVVPVAN
jgi:hypothetical protein